MEFGQHVSIEDVVGIQRDSFRVSSHGGVARILWGPWFVLIGFVCLCLQLIGMWHKYGTDLSKLFVTFEDLWAVSEVCGVNSSCYTLE